MSKIKFGTDGWRAIIAKDYTVENVSRVTEATAHWMLERQMSKVVIGYDCRFGGKMFSEAAACIFASMGIQVVLSNGFVSTPMVSLANVKLGADMGVVITASHNPPSYNGYKLKSSYGGPTIPREIAEIENLIKNKLEIEPKSLSSLKEVGMISYVNLEDLYIRHVEDSFDLEAIRNSDISLAYDAMYGAGMNVIPRILPEVHLLHCDYNPSFKGQAPEPIDRNLQELSQLIANNPDINLGLANDGDADRIGMYDENGKFVDSHHLLLLLLWYLYEYKNMTGKVVVTFSVTDHMKKLAAQYGLPFEVTKIGFKHIAEIMTHDPILVGGEESGGLAVSGHIPERDGIWMGLVIMEFMAKTGKSLSQLVDEVYTKVGKFAFDRDDLHIDEEKKQAIIEKCKTNQLTQIGDSKILKIETIDGFKFYLAEDEWVMIRPSGTEPVLRVYAQAGDASRVRDILDATHATLSS